MSRGDPGLAFRQMEGSKGRSRRPAPGGGGNSAALVWVISSASGGSRTFTRAGGTLFLPVHVMLQLSSAVLPRPGFLQGRGWAFP